MIYVFLLNESAANRNNYLKLFKTPLRVWLRLLWLPLGTESNPNRANRYIVSQAYIERHLFYLDYIYFNRNAKTSWVNYPKNSIMITRRGLSDCDECFGCRIAWFRLSSYPIPIVFISIP